MLDATPLLRAYARWRSAGLAAEDAVLAQRRQLLSLVRRARETRFGRAHGFDRIDGVEAFQAQVPLRRYEDFWQDWWQPTFPRLADLTWPGKIPYFAASSGTTTGITKYIPVSRAMLAANRRAALDILVHHLRARPASRILAGRNFMLGGSTDLVQHDGGIYCGDLSGIAANEIPWWAQTRYFPPRRLALMADWEKKIRLLAPLSLRANIRSIGGTPSWLLLFFAELAALRPDRPARSTSWYPELELCIHGGVGFTPYKAQFETVFAGSPVDLREVYPASEGFIAIADRGGGEGLRLLTDNGLFLEFVPVDELAAPQPTRRWLANVECGVNYAVVVSSNAGLWAYLLGDTVRFVERRPPRMLITGRLSYTLSAFGEHLIGEEIEAAIAAAARSIARQAPEYTVAAEFSHSLEGRGRHSFIVELEPPADEDDVRRFALALDAALAEQNDDYRAHRTGMRAPGVMAVRPGSFAAWMRQRGRIGGQNKVPRVIADDAMFAALQSFMREQGCVTASRDDEA
jgi:GH3 auxin-responsive promoter